MTICMIFTLLPMSNNRVYASETETVSSGEGGLEAQAVSGAAITMATSESVVNYDIWVGGVQVTSQNMNNITGDGIKSVEGKTGKVSYDPEENTLTLKDVQITGVYSLNYDRFFVYANRDLNISLSGDSKIIKDNAYYYYGIHTNGDLTISGSGTLNISLQGSEYGIYTLGGDINIEGGELTISSWRFGIYTDNTFNISQGVVSINVQSSKATTGIRCVDANISGGTLYINIRSTADFHTNNYGIEAINSINITDGTVTVNAETTDSVAMTIGCIITWDSNINISGGNVSVTATSASTGTGSYFVAGLYSHRVVNITGGEVTVTCIGASDKVKSMHKFVRFTNGITKASFDSTGASAIDIEQDKEFTSLQYKYIHYECDEDRILINQAKEAVVGGTLTISYSDNRTAAVQSYVNSLLSGGYTGLTAVVSHVTDNTYKVTFTKGELTDEKESYVNGLLTGDAAGVTAVVSFISGNTYRVDFTLGTLMDSKNISMTINEINTPINQPTWPSSPTPTPTPTPTPALKVDVEITEDNIQVNVEITPDIIEYYEGQINIPITSEEIMNELKNEERTGVKVDLSLPELNDEAEQQEINLILESELIQQAKENKKDISVTVADSNEKVLYSWTFNNEELVNSDKEISDVNLSLKIDKAPEDAPYVEERKEDSEEKEPVTLVVDFAHEGVLPVQASVRIYVGHMEGVTPGTKLYLYHYNEGIKKFETFPYGYQATVDEDGYITINVLQCSDYIIKTKEADPTMYVSLRNQIKVTPTMINLSLAEGKDGGKIEIKLPITLEWVKSLDEPTKQSASGAVTVSFTSSNDEIVEIDCEGNIYAKAPGKATITTLITLYSKKTKKVTTTVNVKP